jgi:hypothetical protein
MYGWFFTVKKPIDNYILDFFFVTNWCWDWSRWLFSWVLEVYNKTLLKKNEWWSQCAVLHFSDEQVLRDMENAVELLSFIVDRETH